MLKQRIGANFKNAESAKINGGLSIFFEKFYTLGSVYPGTNFKEKLSMGSEHTDYTLSNGMLKHGKRGNCRGKLCERRRCGALPAALAMY